MTSCETFLTEKARSFSLGDFSEAARTLMVPSTIYLGRQKLVLDNLSIVEDILRRYRANLCLAGYAETQLEILHVDTPVDQPNSTRVLLRWRNVDTRGRTINAPEGSYFCERDAEGNWHVTLVEFLTEPKPMFASGLPLQ